MLKQPAAGICFSLVLAVQLLIM